MTEKQIEVLRRNQIKPGEVKNPKGRGTGSVNKVNQDVRKMLSLAAESNLPAVNEAIDKLLKSENEFVRSRAIELYLRLLEFSQPRLSAMAVKTDGTSTGVIVIGKPADLELPVPDQIVESEEVTDIEPVPDDKLTSESDGD